MSYEQDIDKLENHMVIWDEEDYYDLYHDIDEPFDEVD